MKLLVCGGRFFSNRVLLHETLLAIHEQTPLTLLLYGDAPGADTLAGDWGWFMGIPVHAEPAEWTKYGKPAGPIRNAKMLAMQPDLVVAFPGNDGTKDCVRQAKRAGLPVKVIDG